VWSADRRGRVPTARRPRRRTRAEYSGRRRQHDRAAHVSRPWYRTYDSILRAPVSRASGRPPNGRGAGIARSVPGPWRSTAPCILDSMLESAPAAVCRFADEKSRKTLSRSDFLCVTLTNAAPGAAFLVFRRSLHRLSLACSGAWRSLSARKFLTWWGGVPTLPLVCQAPYHPRCWRGARSPSIHGPKGGISRMAAKKKAAKKASKKKK